MLSFSPLRLLARSVRGSLPGMRVLCILRRNGPVLLNQSTANAYALLDIMAHWSDPRLVGPFCEPTPIPILQDRHMKPQGGIRAVE